MEWFNNANTITSLVTALFGVIGYIYGIVTYLKKKMSSKYSASSPTQTTTTQNNAASLRLFTWLEWAEAFAQGFINTTDFLIKIVNNDTDITDEPILKRISGGLAICFGGTIILELIFAFGGGIFLSIIGINNGESIGAGIGGILILVTFSLIYVYHVGLVLETKQLDTRKENINNVNQSSYPEKQS